MLLANVALISILELPLHAGVFLEKSVLLEEVILYPLIVDKLRVINNPSDNELIDLIVIQPSNAL